MTVYEDKEGNIWLQDEIEELSFWEIEELKLHVSSFWGQN